MNIRLNVFQAFVIKLQIQIEKELTNMEQSQCSKIYLHY